LKHPPAKPRPVTSRHRTNGAATLAALPVSLSAVYLVNYMFSVGFLAPFGVTPDQVGFNRTTALLRAAAGLLLAIFYFSVTIFFILALLLLAWLIVSLAASRAADGFDYLFENGSDHEKRSLRRKRWTASPFRMLRQSMRFRTASVTSALTFMICVSCFLLDDARPPGWAYLVAVVGCVLLGAGLYRYWERRSLRYSWYAIVCFVAYVALSICALNGGLRAGSQPGDSGSTHSFYKFFFDVDLIQVTPLNLPKSDQPAGYQGEDMLEIGSSTSAYFLYDCRDQHTYQISPSTVTLDYNPNSQYSSPSAEKRIQARLKCSAE
jgi:hypothetical protein